MAQKSIATKPQMPEDEEVKVEEDVMLEDAPLCSVAGGSKGHISHGITLFIDML